MINPLTWLSRRRFPYEPLIRIEISRSAILNNFDQFRRLAPKHGIAPVLKSNAYGHGLFEVAGILESRHGKGIPFFVIDSYFEAVALRSNGIRTPLLIIGYTRPETILSCHLSNIAFTISSLEQLQALEETEREIGIHFKVDTGMHRQGIPLEDMQKAIELLAKNPYIVLEGICSHFSDADNDDPSFTEGQIHAWNRLIAHLKNDVASLKHIHLSNTFGHRYTPDIDANVSRLGLGLYGLADGTAFPEPLKLIPVLTMKSLVYGIKKIQRDDPVGYGNAYRAERDMTIALVPAGYYEGVDRRLSSRGFVQVGPDKVMCPIVGRVSMNITILDVSHVVGVKEGMEAVIFSNIASDPNSIMSQAKKGGLIPYELAVHIPGVLRRIIVT